MYVILNRKSIIFIFTVLIISFVLIINCIFFTQNKAAKVEENIDFINWVDFKVPCQAMEYAIKLDVETHDTEVPLHWIELLAYLAAKNGNNFNNFHTGQLDEVAKQLQSGKSMDELTQDMKYYAYYHEAYSAVLSQFVGEYEIEVKDDTAENGKRWEKEYGLKAFSPIAKGYYYNDYDDFGTGRSYGYNRRHLGHDLMGNIGTPIIAVEGGTVEALGWDEFGGWRIGIRSFDKKRYYYYAHLRQDFPYAALLQIGSTVKPGDVIGYLGHTGYSTKENVNNISQPHLHFGMQLIFDESQKDGNNEIWIDVYEIVKLLQNNRVEVVKNSETQEYSRVYDIREVPVE